MRAHDTHVTASITKSVVSLLVGHLLLDGSLSRTQTLPYYVPELAGTAFGDASLDHLLHMTTAVRYEGRPFEKEMEARRFFAAVGMMPRPEDYVGPRNIMERLATARAEQPSGRIFRYENGNTEALGEAVRRVAGISSAELASDLLWSRIGATENAHFTLDPSGREIACGRFSSTLETWHSWGRSCAAAWPPMAAAESSLKRWWRASPGFPRDRPVMLWGSGDVRGANGPVMAYHDCWWLPLDGEGAFVARGRSGPAALRVAAPETRRRPLRCASHYSRGAGTALRAGLCRHRPRTRRSPARMSPAIPGVAARELGGIPVPPEGTGRFQFGARLGPAGSLPSFDMRRPGGATKFGTAPT